MQITIRLYQNAWLYTSSGRTSACSEGCREPLRWPCSDRVNAVSRPWPGSGYDDAPAVYLDLQDRADRAKLNEPELFFEHHRDELVCLDEIQLLPEFFSALRSEIDRDRRPGRFLILGSASRDLIRQSNETLAGRITQVELTPFLLPEVAAVTDWKTSVGPRRLSGESAGRRRPLTVSIGGTISSAPSWSATSRRWASMSRRR